MMKNERQFPFFIDFFIATLLKKEVKRLLNQVHLLTYILKIAQFFHLHLPTKNEPYTRKTALILFSHFDIFFEVIF